MLLPIARNLPGSDPRVVALRGALDEFYGKTTDYDAFVESPDNRAYYRLLAPVVRKALEGRERVTVLEYGTGRTTFPQFLDAEGLRARVRFVAQDVTAQNEAYLRPITDEFFVGDVSRMNGPVDLAFSTFVLEHVSNPEELLESVARLLPPGGVHVIFCPNYELPGYLCPSLRHLSRAKRALATAFLTSSRLAASLDRHPRFWVNLDPAVRHVRWYRDADAVYLVSRRELEAWHERRGFSVERLGFGLPARLGDWKGHLLRSAITTKLALTKTREA